MNNLKDAMRIKWMDAYQVFVTVSDTHEGQWSHYLGSQL